MKLAKGWARKVTLTYATARVKSSFSTGVRRLVELADDNLSVVIVATLFGAVLVYVSTLANGIVPTATIATPLGWSSWIDAFVTFPLLSVACLILFRNSRNVATLLSLVSVTVVYVILSTYYYAYATGPFGLAALSILPVAIAPANPLVLVLLFPVAGALMLSWGVLSARIEIASWADTPVFVFVAAISVLLVVFQMAVRLLANGGLFGSGNDLLGWVSDIGIGTDFAARDLLHGINPYSHPIPPWGGYASLYYGPFAFLAAVPFALLPVGIGAHAATAFYFGITAVGVWKCVRIWNQRYAASAAMFLVALPLSSWFLDGAFEIHAIATSIIVWSLYSYLSGRHLWASLLAGIGFFTLVVPGALIILYTLRRGSLPSKLIDLSAFALPVGVVAALVLLIYPGQIVGALHGLFSGWGVGQNVNVYLTASANQTIRLILTVALLVWMSYRSYTLPDHLNTVRTAAVFYLLLPFAAGYFIPFFSIWGVPLAIVALFAVAARNHPEKNDALATAHPDGG